MPEYQRAIPEGARFLALVPWPSQLDFRRNDVSVMDWPGMIGPPGMPALDDVPGWQIYLRRAGFGYVAYSYGDEVGYGDAAMARDIAYFSQPAHFSQYQVDLLTGFRGVKHVFDKMMACGAVFDDQAVVVIDLAKQCSFLPDVARKS